MTTSDDARRCGKEVHHDCTTAAGYPVVDNKVVRLSLKLVTEAGLLVEIVYQNQCAKNSEGL